MMPCLMQGAHLDFQNIEQYKQESVSLLERRAFKQMGYGAFVAASVVYAGMSMIALNDNKTLSMFIKDYRGFKDNENKTWMRALTSTVFKLSYEVGMGLLSSSIVGLTKGIVAHNGFVQNAYQDVVSSFTTPTIDWYIQYYVPLYKHLENFKTCAVYFDLDSPFLQDVHSNAITLRYVQGMMQGQDEIAGYAQFLQRKAERDMSNAQALVQYDEQITAYRYRKAQGQTLQEDKLLLQKLRIIHAQLVQDIERIIGFIYAHAQYQGITPTQHEQEFLRLTISKVDSFLAQLYLLIDGFEQDRCQASSQGNGIFTIAHEFELYLKNTLQS
jgi:hypothetical protein